MSKPASDASPLEQTIDAPWHRFHVEARTITSLTGSMNKPTFTAASDRNKQPIAEQLLRLLADRVSVLEIGSGWGQHAVYFSRMMPHLKWQPSDREEVLHELEEQLNIERNPAIKPAIALNVLDLPWDLNQRRVAEQFDAVYSANTAHIMPWDAVCAMFSGAGQCLSGGGLFILYGPFNIGGRFTAPSNESFDRSLRARDAQMGIRDLESLETLAAGHQMSLAERISMPANNFLLVFLKIQRG